jgi:hypothetical protein
VTCDKDLLLHYFNTWFCKVQAVGPEICEICASFLPEGGITRAKRRAEDEGGEEEMPAARRLRVDADAAAAVASRRSSVPNSDLFVNPFKAEAEAKIEGDVNFKREDGSSPEYYIKGEPEIEPEINSEPVVKTEMKAGEQLIKSEPGIKPDPEVKAEGIHEKALFWMTLENCIRAAEDRVGMELAGVMIDDYAEEEGLNFLFLNLN